MRIIGKILTLAAAVLLMAGCSPVKLPNPSTYQLAPTMPVVAPVNKPVAQTLLVSLPQNAAGYDTEKMAYVQHQYQLGYFTKNQWVDDPASMLQPLMVQTLQDSHHFAAVTGAPFSGATDWRLDTTVLSLQQDFLTKPSQIELTVDARLVQTATQRIVAGKRFIITVPAPSNTPYGGVQAANQATTIFLQQLTQFVVSAS
jgi:cholesterol transport system auxiliary component